MAKKKVAKKASAKKSAQRESTPVESIRHADTRKNIPTEELRDFVSDQELAPTKRLYPRDPSLDPQLVWRGKDEQDAQDLAVPVVPIYIQEKIHPQALVDDLLASVRSGSLPLAGRPGEGGSASATQLDLFADFNGLPDEFDQRIDFYQHDGHWSNRMILGDSLLVMTSLAEKEGLRGQVQTIYLDPPYGIKFGSNWQVSTRKRDVKDGKAEDATRQPEQVRAFRDTWKLGIHSYLAYLRDRLVAARELLTETGSVFAQIGDENVHLVRSVMDEVLGSENFVVLITIQKTGAQPSELLAGVADYVIWYAKQKDIVKSQLLYRMKEHGVGEGSGARYTLKDEAGCFYQLTSLTSARPPGDFPVEFEGRTYRPNGRYWTTGREGFDKLIAAKRVIPAARTIRYKRQLDDFPAYPITSIWTDVAGSPDKAYVVQTSPLVVQRCLLMTTDPGDLVLDPTCGSGTTAYVAEQWGRRWITCDTSRVALALARTRLMVAKFPYYYLAAEYPQIGPTAADEEIKLALRSPLPNPPRRGEGAGGARGGEAGDVKKGFVYRRVPHVTLKSIANNPDIKEGMSRAEIDAAIARHADTETLFDQPYEDKKRVRVSGPFTVESLSPHRTISVEEKRRRSENWDHGRSLKVFGPDDFATMIIDNLRKAGVQNTVKNERLKFDSLNPYAGEWIHAEGHYTEHPLPGPPRKGEGTGEGVVKRAAVSIGPEHGTVGAQLVKEAAKEAVKGVGFDLLIVCGFAFDPSVSEEAKRYGKLTVLPARMNPDLAMGDELLKKTGAGNLFMVFGEPDMEVTKQKDGQLAVEIRGLDVYDPTTGDIRNSSTDDIACWFIDTAYNGESFFVRHAYFTGADEPYDKLKRALRAEIDEAAWSSLYSTTSRPFPRPDTGKIAVKVINHYGDEVMKVYEV